MIQGENGFFFKTATFTIKVFYATKLYVKVKEEFRNEYPKSVHTPKSIIKDLIDKCEKKGMVHDALGKGGKKLPTPEKRDEITQLIEV